MLKKITKILSETKPYKTEHHMGLPFLSAYQIAIELERQFPSEIKNINNLPSFIARTLSQSIQNGECENIEGGFISHQNIKNLNFSNGYEITDQPAHSIFRYIGQ